MKTYHEEWIAVVNKTKYTLNEKHADLLKDRMTKGDKSPIFFKDFTIFPAFVEEFYLNEKVYDILPQLSFENEIKIDEAEKARVRARIDKFRKDFFKEHEIKQPKTLEEINKRRNELLDQAEKR